MSATGGVPGTIQTPYSMDEYHGSLRVASTEGSYGNDVHDLYVLQAKGPVLQVVGQLPGFAQQDMETAIRFLGDHAYVATSVQYVQVLDALDLSDPAHPAELTQSSGPGFAFYLQPLDDAHLLAIYTNWDRASVALYDSSDFEHPQLSSSYDLDLFPERGSWFGPYGWLVDYNKAIYYPQSHLLEYHVADWLEQEESWLLLLQVGPQAGESASWFITKAGEFHQDMQLFNTQFIGDRLYTVSEESIATHRLSNLSGAAPEVRLVDEPRQPEVPTNTTLVNQAFQGSLVEFTISSAVDLHATIDWGDGFSSEGTMELVGPSRFAVLGQHTYSQPGSYTPVIRRSGPARG